MAKECILQRYTGFDHCPTESLGDFAMQMCCSGYAGEKMTTLELMALIATHTKTADIEDLVNLDVSKGEDPRIVRLVNDLREKRGVTIRAFDDGYMDYAEYGELRRLDIRKLASAGK